MSVTDVHGTQTTTVTTEHTLADTAAVGSYIVKVDLSDMVAGDIIEVRAYDMVLTGGTRRPTVIGRWVGLQPPDDQNRQSIPISTALTDSGAIRFTLKQTQGVSTDIPWSVIRFA